MRHQPCFEDVAGFNDRWMLVGGIPLAGMLVSLLLFNQYYAQGNWQYLTLCIPMSMVYTASFWFSMRWVYKRVKMRYPTFEQIRIRAWLALVGFLVVYLLVNLTLDTFFKWIFPQHQGPPSQIVEFITSLILCSLVISIYEAISFYIQLNRAITEKTKIERHYVQSQLEGLRNQVNPHFLFNSLNTLVYLIPEDTDKAVRFVQKLSKVYRYVLESRDAQIIPLCEEMDFLQSYIFLLKERFGDNLSVEIADFQHDANTAIVPLTMQMLFENAIKHNVISTGKPLKIEVFAQNGHLVVRNNLQRKNQVMDSTGVGLDNIRARYQIFTDQSVDVSTDDQFFTVRLPRLSLSAA